MREIKFRAWDKKHKIMRSGVVMGENAELMQYTGLKDKNGKEIYEGDIVGRRKEHCWEVKYIECGFELCFLGTDNPIANQSVLRYNSNMLEIFGNVYQNPELLKEAK